MSGKDEPDIIDYLDDMDDHLVDILEELKELNKKLGIVVEKKEGGK